MPAFRLVRHVPFVALCLLLASCAGSRETAPPDPPPDRPPPADPTPVTRTMQGFRIQILTTPEKHTADFQVENALGWLGDLSRRPTGLESTEEAPVYLAWRQPYYRVRMGNFATREEAQQALYLVGERFPEAFIVPDTVTVTR